MSLLDNKVIIVTGGTQGIGEATSHRLAEEGAIVYACARHNKQLEGSRIEFRHLDVTKYDECEQVVSEILAIEGRIDGIVANAGITSDALTLKMTEEAFDNVINVNLKGVYNIVKAAASVFNEQTYGNIVTISSVVGQYGNIGQANYAASKAGIIGMTKSWAKEFARKGKRIRVNCVAPGYILTDMVRTVPQNLLDGFAAQTMLGRLGQPNEIANVIVFLLSEQSSYITGAVIDVNGGMRL